MTYPTYRKYIPDSDYTVVILFTDTNSGYIVYTDNTAIDLDPDVNIESPLFTYSDWWCPSDDECWAKLEDDEISNLNLPSPQVFISMHPELFL